MNRYPVHFLTIQGLFGTQNKNPFLKICQYLLFMNSLDILTYFNAFALPKQGEAKVANN
jgi:hypothetical protein